MNIGKLYNFGILISRSLKKSTISTCKLAHLLRKTQFSGKENYTLRIPNKLFVYCFASNRDRVII